MRKAIKIYDVGIENLEQRELHLHYQFIHSVFPESGGILQFGSVWGGKVNNQKSKSCVCIFILS